MIKPYKMIWILVLFYMFFVITNANSQQVDPNIRYQTLEGWGTSLSWWANLVGEYPDDLIDQICDDLTNPEELNMNVFRYNIHGGDNPLPHSEKPANHFRKDSGPITSYKSGPDAPYDWTANANQRKILKKILERKPDAILEAISYSPPYWMTKSQCSAGAVDKQSNLPIGNENDFAEFLTDIVQFYKDSLGITFQTLTGLNEPSSGYWGADGIQEGCGIYVEQQAKLISEIYDHLKKKNMLSYCNVSGPEESKINQTMKVLASKDYEEIMNKFDQINTHSYNSENSVRSQVANLANKYNKTIWQSESGPLGVPISDSYENNLYVAANQIIPDLKELKAQAWVDWQAASTSKKWGYYTLTDSTETLTKHKNYYVRKQFSKYLKPGSTLIDIRDSTAVAAISKDEKQMVIVHVNQTKSSKKLDFDLSKFNGLDPTVKVVRTSVTENTKSIPTLRIIDKKLSYSSPPQSVTTFIVDISL